MSDLAHPQPAGLTGPAVVVADAGAAGRAEGLLGLAGWSITDAVPPAPWWLGDQGLALRTTVADAPDVAAVVEARVRGTAVLVVASDACLRSRLVADLRRMAPVDEPDTRTDPTDQLDPPQLALLVALGNGSSVRAAARQLHLSVRTAYRRLDAARATLGDVPLGTAVGRVLAAQAAWRPGAVGGTADPPLIGRDAEVEQVRGALAAGCRVRVVGPPGSGVSAVALAGAAATGRPVARIKGFDLCRDRPRLAVAALLGRAPSAREPRTVARELAAALAGRALVVDDAQWLDPASAEVLEVLGATLPVVTGVVDADAGADPGRPTDGPDLAADPAVARTVVLGPLAAVDARRLALSVPDLVPDSVDGVVRRAGGWPGALLAAARREAETDELDSRAAVAIGHLTPTGRATIARAVAAGGTIPTGDVEPAVASELADLPFPCSDAGGAVVLRPAVLMAVRGALAPDELRDAHRHVAAALADSAGAALHWMAAGEPGVARRVALAELAADPSAAGVVQRRADLLAVIARTAPPHDRARRTAEAASALAASGRSADAAQLVEDVTATDSSLLGDPRLVAVRASLLLNQGAVVEARAVVDAALAADDLVAVSEVALRSVRAAAQALAGADAQAVVDDAQRAVDAHHGSDGQARMLRGAGLALMGDASWPEILLPGFEEALVRGNALEIAVLTEIVSQASILYDDPTQAEHALARGIAALPENAEARRQLELHRAVDEVIVRGPTEVNLDRLRGALEAAPPGRQHRVSWAILAMGLADRGRVADAGGALACAEASPTEPNGDRALDWARAEVALLAGRPEEARVHAEAAAAGAPTHFPAQAAAAATARWAVLDGAGPSDAARPESVFPQLKPLTDEADGLDALLAGDAARAVELLRRCVSAGGMIRNQRRSRWALGEALRRDGQTTAARGVLEDLAAEAEGADLRPLLSRVRATLRKVGVAGGAPTGRHPSGLTEREVEVLLLVAEGLSTPDISARLHIARSTVDTLIRSARRKLDARTRREAAAVLVAWQPDPAPR